MKNTDLDVLNCYRQAFSMFPPVVISVVVFARGESVLVRSVIMKLTLTIFFQSFPLHYSCAQWAPSMCCNKVAKVVGVCSARREVFTFDKTAKAHIFVY